MTGSAPRESPCSPLLDDGLVERAMIPDLEANLDRAHCLLLVGPYEVGKSHVARTIARRFGAGASVILASDPHHRSSLAGSSSVLQDSRGRLVVIDEVHAAPEALDAIRLELENWVRDRVPVGQFLLLSSRPLEVAPLVAARLGTRVQVRSLPPIGLADLAPARSLLQSSAVMSMATDLADTEPIARPNIVISADTLRLRGGFPQSLFADDDTTSFAWREHYVTNLCIRGFDDGGHRLHATTIRDFLTVIAVNQGEQRPIEGAAQKAYVDHLCDLGLLRVLRPWGANETKRMKRSPKIYIGDTGLLHCLQRRRSLDDIRASSSAQGHSWETFCIEHLIRAAPHADAYFYRDEDQNEIDLVLEFSRTQRLGIEIKSEGGLPRSGFDVALRAIAPAMGYVVKPIPESITGGRHPILTLSDMIGAVSDHSRLGGPRGLQLGTV
jgi:uncharacterized protein